MFGIYIHWPFCASKCPYCDFNSHVTETIDHDAWSKAYLKEIDYYADLAPGRTVTSIFFGGGTPSLMEPKTVADIIHHIQTRWCVSNDVEITLEANPTSVETEKFKAFRAAGINRVSLGVQALNDTDLKFLGRQHDVRQALAAVETASAVFDRYSFDLIYARPGQSVRAWQTELQTAFQYAGDHVSVYQLTIEQGTPFYIQERRGDFRIPGEDLAGDLYEVTQDILNNAGMPAYEVSNHAKAGAESIHNLTYWRYADYIGIGPGAHGRLTFGGEKLATRAHRAPELWMKRVQGEGHGSHSFETLSQKDRITETVMMGLRLQEGLPYQKLAQEAGQNWRRYIDFDAVGKMQKAGYLAANDNGLTPTSEGLQRLNGMLARILTDPA